METNSWRKNRVRQNESGQALVFLVLALGLVFVGAGALSVDMSNLWFHRQAAQNAADAACTAGAMDLLVGAQGGATGHQGFVAGTAFACSAGSTAAPCQYAAKNGYTSDGTGNQVSVSFPATVAGVPTIAVPPSGIAPSPFLRVDVTDNIQTYFSGLLSGNRTQTVRAFAVCGVVLASAPVPLLVLDPRSADGATLSTQGNPTVAIYGGPQRSIQVNSPNSAAVNIGGSSLINLSQGGPAIPPTGSDLAIYGSEGQPSTSKFNPGTTGHWLAPAAPVADPYSQIPAPAQPTDPALVRLKGGLATTVPNGTDGCPDTTCHEYAPGYYPNGIEVKHFTAIFQPGIYWVQNGLSADSLSCMRPSTALGDGSGGTLFYFADTSSISVGSNSGSSCPTGAGKDFATTTGTGSLAFGAKCTSASQIPSNLPATLTGSVLLAPCQAPTVSSLCAPNCAINYGDPLGASNPIGEQRGILFFQNRAVNAGNSPNWGGGGQFLLAGTMYFHQCVTTGTDTGTGCSSTSAYQDILSFGGNSGASTYVLGSIVADQVQLQGTSGITMDLSPTTSYNILKATLLR